MKTQDRARGAPTVPAAAPAANTDSPLHRFSLQLATRFPNRLIKRFVMPSAVRECREVFIIEITSNEEIEAAIIADGMMSAIEKQSQKLAGEAERREAVRLAIVGLGRTADKTVLGEVSYEHCNDQGIPLSMQGWTMRAWTALHTYFGQVNGVPAEELASGIMEAQTVGAFAPPTSAIRASADTGRSDASSGAST